MSDDLTNTSRKAIRILEIIDSNIANYSHLLTEIDLKKLTKIITAEFTIWAVCDKYIHERVTLCNSSYNPDCFDTIPKEIFYDRLDGYMGTSKESWPQITQEWPYIFSASVLSHDINMKMPQHQLILHTICTDILFDYYVWEQAQAMKSMQSLPPMSDTEIDYFKNDPIFNLSILIEYNLFKCAYKIIPEYKSIKDAVEQSITKLKPIPKSIIQERFFEYAGIGFTSEKKADHLHLIYQYIYYTYVNGGNPINYYQFRYHMPPHRDKLEIIAQRYHRYMMHDLKSAHDKKKIKAAIIIIIGIILLMIIATLTK